MPKKPIDYSKALIYSIVCKTDETILYIGSTTNFTKRKNSHKNACHNENNKDYNYQVYVMIRANGGWDNFEMKPVKEYSCENNIQLVIEEERIRKEMKATLNTKIAYRTIEEKQEYNKKYRGEHKKEIKEYYEEHKKEIKEYYQDHKEELKEYGRKWREANKDKVSEYEKKRQNKK